MRVCCLFSGGKDSAFALHRMLLSGFEVPVLLTIRPDDPDSWLYHTPGMEVSHLFEELTGIHTEVVRSEDPEKEEEILLIALRELKERYDLDGVCSGALLSDYQRMRFSQTAMEAGLVSYTPLWRKDGKRYMEELLGFGFSFMLVSYSSPGFEPADLGCEVTEEMMDGFFKTTDKWGAHPAFEGGEAETLVLGGPCFPGKLKVEGKVVEKGQYSARFLIDSAEVV